MDLPMLQINITFFREERYIKYNDFYYPEVNRLGQMNRLATRIFNLGTWSRYNRWSIMYTKNAT